MCVCCVVSCENDQVTSQEQESATEWVHLVAHTTNTYRRRLLLVTVDTDYTVQDLVGMAIEEFLQRYTEGEAPEPPEQGSDREAVASRVKRKAHRELLRMKVRTEIGVRDLAGMAIEEFLDDRYPVTN